jgi:hypothetical protein
MWRLHLVVLAALLLMPRTLLGSAQDRVPAVVLVIPDYAGARFGNFSSILLPNAGPGKLEVILSNAASSITVHSVRMMLNNQPMAVFLATMPMTDGLRTVLDLQRASHPSYRLRPEGENSLTFEAVDQTGNRYFGQFFLRVAPGLSKPELAPAQPTVLQKAFEPPPSHQPPQIQWLPTDQPQVGGRTVWFKAEITDDYGLRAVILEVNGKELESIVLENGSPTRKRGGFRTARSLPGTVQGNGMRLTIEIPVELKKAVNVLAIRAENLRGLYGASSRTLAK